MKALRIILIFALVSLCLGLAVFTQRDRLMSLAKEAALKILINNKESTLQPLESDGVLFVPLSFPVTEGKSSWQVSLDYDKNAKTVTIQKVKNRQKVREKTKCSRCSGTGKCQACYPAGSGETASGGTCGICDGTGKCFYCDGKGEY